MSRLPKFEFQKKASNDLGERINNILYIIIFALALIIIITTIIGFLSHKAKIGKNLRTPDPAPSEIETFNRKNNTNLDAYTALGTFRLTTKNEKTSEEKKENEEITFNQTLLVVEPWFSYPKDDISYYEELSRKRIVMSGIITNYFTTKTKEEIMQIDEDKIKQDLLNQINAELSLGKIEELYFTQFMFLN